MSIHPFFAFLASVVGVLTIQATFLWAPAKPPAARFATIDGLRGYLAFFVFLHHAAVWYGYCRTGRWIVPDSHLYTHLGQSSVALFFMITSFLFYDKLLNSEQKRFAWQSFFISRVFRLTPLYVVTMITMFFIVAVLSGWTLIDQPRYLFFCCVRWLLFTVPGAPQINLIDSGRIVAGVTWSLPYEWCFYLILPLVALTTRQRPPLVALGIAAAGLVLAWYANLQANFAMSFIGGMLAARVVRYPSFCRYAKKPVASVLALACFAVVLLFPTAFDLAPLVFLTSAFCLIAGGTSLFGLLQASTSHRLGELAYSIYLVHGILLFTTLHFLVGEATIATMSNVAYWMLIALLVPVVLGVAACTFRYIEQPGIALGNKLRRRRSRMEASLGAPAPTVAAKT